MKQELSVRLPHLSARHSTSGTVEKDRCLAGQGACQERRPGWTGKETKQELSVRLPGTR